MIRRSGKVVQSLPIAEDGFSVIRIHKEDNGFALGLSVAILALLVCCVVLCLKWRGGHFSRLCPQQVAKSSRMAPSFISGLCTSGCRKIQDAVDFFSYRANLQSKRTPFDGVDIERGDGDGVGDKASCEKQEHESLSINPTLLMTKGNVEDLHSPEATLEKMIVEEYLQAPNADAYAVVEGDDIDDSLTVVPVLCHACGCGIPASVAPSLTAATATELALARSTAEEPLRAQAAEVIDARQVPRRSSTRTRRGRKLRRSSQTAEEGLATRTADLSLPTPQDAHSVGTEDHVWTPPFLTVTIGQGRQMGKPLKLSAVKREVDEDPPASAFIASKLMPDDFWVGPD